MRSRTLPGVSGPGTGPIALLDHITRLDSSTVTVEGTAHLLVPLPFVEKQVKAVVKACEEEHDLNFRRLAHGLEAIPLHGPTLTSVSVDDVSPYAPMPARIITSRDNQKLVVAPGLLPGVKGEWRYAVGKKRQFNLHKKGGGMQSLKTTCK